MTQGTFFDSIALAIQSAVDGDELVANLLAFEAESDNIDFLGKGVSLLVNGSIVQPGGGVIVMADNSTLATPPGQSITLAGQLQVPFVALADIVTLQLIVASTGSLTVEPGAGVFIEAEGGINNSGSMSIFGLVDAAAGLHNEATGTMNVSGFIFGNVINDNDATFNGDSYVI